ncbi:MAG TPA: biliverdin-producing heme oxygenase [Candidatus Agrococcus pullicola]|uniref:Biliverdin-producing heme oxygenase n=1 Tax=Candidatus Agrococcus pullicola TaxID=2838429 RepID=A0A9D1Z0K0_9MICO|nr:biliverdin-producing heme oxygenase [Candidatus Agrococcus pullicola]
MSRTSTRNAADIPMDELPVSGLLRSATSKAHESAETANFIGKLMRGQLSIEAWQLMLEQLDYVYRALETTANEMRDGDQCAELLYTELDRADSIEHDLRALRVRTGVDPIGMLASTREYVDRILSCRNDGVRYVAHHYTRYLGDLSGGQVMRVKFKEHYGLQDDEATFFRFEHIDSGPRFKKRYREHLDALDLDQAGRERIVEEANASFMCNQRIFEELDEIVTAQQRAA